MSTNTTYADRIGRAGLALVSLANMLFLAVFIAALLFAAGRVAADDAPACHGSDMLAAFAADKPQVMAEIRAQADKVPNGKGLLWRIEHEGAKPSWLFGTMHMSDPRVLKLPQAAQAAFDAAGTMVIETTDILDQAKMTAALMARPELMMFTDATTLSSLLPPEDKAMVEQELERRGIALESVQKMQPWMLSALVNMPACELARKAQGAPLLDMNLAQEAQKAGKELAGLETMADQLEAMASLPMDFHLRGLVETLRLGDRMEDVMETMVRIYLAGDTGMFRPFFEAVVPSDGEEGEEGYAAFQEKMIDARNETMADGAAALIEKGNAFIAVGALHLAGEHGLVELLRQRGFRVEPAG